MDYDDTFSLYGRWVQFYENDLLTVVIPEEACGNANPIRPSGFYDPALGNCRLNRKERIDLIRLVCWFD